MSFARPHSPELVAVVENFLVFVSGEANISRETVEAVSITTKACFFEKSISVHEFIQQATRSLKNYPILARRLNAFLHSCGEQLLPILNDSSTVELIIIHGAEGGQIYPVSDAIQVPGISNTATLRALLHKDTIEPHFTNATSSSSWARAIAELLQHELNHSSLDIAHRTKCLRYLRRLTLRNGILPPSFLVPDVIYDGSRPVFGGGFADVYKGKLNDAVVCLKVLRFFVERPEMARELLIDCCREALVWKQLNHPNVLPFLGVNVELFAPSFCLVSPWMSNGNLLQFLHRNPDFDRRNAITDIAAAMQYLHEYSPPIVHADIRCANVLVDSDLRCRLADFGLSSISASFTLTNSSSGNGKGSTRWLAPEFFTAGDANQFKSMPRDIYAFACTILEVYTSQHPFVQHKHDGPVIHDVLSGRRPSRPMNISDDLWALVEACWHQDPTSRPSARTVVQTLQPGSVDLITLQTMTINDPNDHSHGHPILSPPAIVNGGKKSPVADKGRPTFGVGLAEQMARDDVEVPLIVSKCCEAIEKHGLESQGIYRVIGTSTKIQALKQRLDKDVNAVDLDTPEWSSGINNVASVLKLWFRELPDSLLTVALHQGFINAAKIENERLRHIRLHERVNDLPDANYSTLKYFFGHLYRINQHATENSMTMQNLATVFGQTLFAHMRSNGQLSSGGTADRMHQITAIETILNHYNDIFVDEGE